MKKKTLTIISSIIIIALIVAGLIYFCLNKTKNGAPQGCELYYELNEIKLMAEKTGRYEEADNCREGMPEDIALYLGDGTTEDLKIKDFDQGVTIENVTDGKAKHILDYQGVLWDGKLYRSYVIKAENAVLPGFYTGSGGILVLDISGECSIQNGDSENACFNGFDSVIIIGDGKLTVNNGEGLIDINENKFEIPALIINGVDVVCERVNISNNKGNLTYLQMGGSLETNLLKANKDVCIAGGELKTSGFLDSKIERLVVRDGMALIGAIIGEESEVKEIIVSGGKISFLETLPENTYIKAGAGMIVAPELSKHTNYKKGKAEILDTYVDGNPLYEYYDIEE